MVVIGLTGGIGCGKSTVAALLAERGGVVVDADQLAREVVEPGQPAHAEIVARFGLGVLGRDGRLDRSALASIVFTDPAARADLEGITHPRVATRIAERVAAEAGTDHVVVLDVPLLVEAGYSGVDGVIVVDCAPEVAVRRLVDQRSMSEDEVRRRMAAQASREDRRSRADVVIVNDGSLEELGREVERVWRWIDEVARTSRSRGSTAPDRRPATS